jgi:hypothetical protein
MPHIRDKKSVTQISRDWTETGQAFHIHLKMPGIISPDNIFRGKKINNQKQINPK